MPNVDWNMSADEAQHCINNHKFAVLSNSEVYSGSMFTKAVQCSRTPQNMYQYYTFANRFIPQMQLAREIYGLFYNAYPLNIRKI